MKHFINDAKWRYATKKFDSTKIISDEDLSFLKEAIQLSASSFGLQPYKVLIIENKELRNQLLAASWNQQQIVDSSHLLVFANTINFGENEINAAIQTTASTRNIPLDSLQGYSEFMKTKLLVLPNETLNNWTAHQTYLAMGNLLNAAAELKIDVTPMEGFEPEKYNQILGLDKQNLNAVLVATIGYRHAEDTTQHYAKVRKSQEELFETIK